ncbi:MAG: hypothetical protein OET07_16445 [Desulfobacteraceae bacterium]|nr:hypothetical protein [Desulfobacteraceae bacterium]MDH3837911.1 hypothetical protein [Desulfobacteraceae bacterium]MDH3875732.1 hypothetical protein [Desulfobacteraceae bacterium]
MISSTGEQQGWKSDGPLLDNSDIRGLDYSDVLGGPSDPIDNQRRSQDKSSCHELPH